MMHPDCHAVQRLDYSNVSSAVTYFRENSYSPLQSKSVIRVNHTPDIVKRGTQTKQLTSLMTVDKRDNASKNKINNHQKTLREKINQKLQQSNKNKRHIHPQTQDKENTTVNNNQQSTFRMSCIRKMLFQDQSEHQTIKQGVSMKGRRGNSKQKDGREYKVKNSSRYQFEERQRVAVEKKRVKQQEYKRMKSHKELEACTFKPQLTKYNKCI